jgi:DNA-binding transcriptional MerR regulator
MSDIAIGELPRQTGVKVPTIRYYEGVGLLPKPPRTESNRRLYGEVSIKRLRFIRHARELGFEIEAIRGGLILQNSRSARAPRSTRWHVSIFTRSSAG